MQHDPNDERNTELTQQARRNRIKREALSPLPVQGDALRYPDGYIRRVAHMWDDGPQPASWGGQGSIYIDPKSGYASYSGALNQSIPNEVLTLAADRLEQRFWFFSHDYPGAHRGVDCMISVRVWDVSIDDTGTRKMS
jgi:hypothetical protein